MGMIKNIEIDGKEVAFKASAAIPRIYRSLVGIFIETWLLWREMLEITRKANLTLIW